MNLLQPDDCVLLGGDLAPDADFRGAKSQRNTAKNAGFTHICGTLQRDDDVLIFWFQGFGKSKHWQLLLKDQLTSMTEIDSTKAQKKVG